MGGNVSTPSSVTSKGSNRAITPMQGPQGFFANTPLTPETQARGEALALPMAGGKGPAAPVSPYQTVPVGAPPPPELRQAPPPSPLVQQMMRPPMQQFNPMQAYAPQMAQPMMSGLPMALAMLRGQFNQMMAPRPAPQMMPMPQYRSPASMYRPNMGMVQQNLSRVKPSVQKQQQDAQAARITELEEQLSRFTNPFGSDGGG